MMQRLLTERFQLAVHEEKAIPHLELSVSRKGLKVAASGPGAERRPSTYRAGRSIYDVHLEWTPEDAPPPDIFQAAEEELGLHLAQRNTPIEAIAIDHADQVPIPN